MDYNFIPEKYLCLCKEKFRRIERSLKTEGFIWRQGDPKFECRKPFPAGHIVVHDLDMELTWEPINR